jgi:hypothetical protein
MRFSLAAALGLLTFGAVLCFLGTTSYEFVAFYLSLAVALLFPVVLLAMVIHGDASQRVFAVGALLPLVLMLVLSLETLEEFDLQIFKHVVRQTVYVEGDPFPSPPSDPFAPQMKPRAPTTISTYWRYEGIAREHIDRTWSYCVLAFVCGGVALLTKTILARGQAKSSRTTLPNA